jgi:hypothetical protein
MEARLAGPVATPPVDTVTGLAERGIGCRSLQEPIDTITPAASRQRPLKLYYLSACLRPPMGTV